MLYFESKSRIHLGKTKSNMCSFFQKCLLVFQRVELYYSEPK
jgi:hypothetical protein